MTRAQANGLVLLAAVLWGSGNVAQQQLLTFMGPMLANGLRCLIAFACVCPLLLWKSRKLRSLDFVGITLLAFSAVFFTLATAFSQMSLVFTTVTANGVLINTCMIMTPFFALLLFRDKASPLIWPASAIAFAGTAIMSGGRITSFGPGEVLCLMAAIAFAAWMVLLSRFVARYGRAALASATQFLCAGLVSTTLSISFEINTLTQVMNSWQTLLMAAIIGTAGGYFLMAIAQAKTTASETAIIGSMEAVFAALGGFIVLGERLPVHAYAGLLVIIAGILLSQIPPHVLRKAVDRSAPARLSPAHAKPRATARRLLVP